MYRNEGSDLLGRFENWWRRDNQGLPLMHVVAIRDNAQWTVPGPRDLEQKYLDPEYILAGARQWFTNVRFMGDSYANISADIGPGSLALYLGCEPRLAWNTVWYEPCFAECDTLPALKFDPENKWWKKHCDIIRTVRDGAGADGSCLVNIPDLIENLDIYAAMRGPQNALFDMMDDPEMVENAVAQIDETYFDYYDAMYDLVRDKNGVSSYTCFQIMGQGRVGKVQCDFSAMISPAQFRRFVLPSLRKQVKRLDHSLYHLDGPDAIRHVPALMELEELDALQWTCGAGQPDGACPRWYGIYDQVTAAGKGLWIQLYEGGLDQWIRGAESLMMRYGKKSLYFQFPGMNEKDAEYLMNYAQTHWDD